MAVHGRWPTELKREKEMKGKMLLIVLTCWLIGFLSFPALDLLCTWADGEVAVTIRMPKEEAERGANLEIGPASCNDPETGI
jgi:hypothetical protein